MNDELRRIEETARTPTSERLHGVDSSPEQRPGVPMEARPALAEGASADGPRQQGRRDLHFRRAGLEELTPVFGTAQPPHGTSGRLRRRAYEVPEHFARHWALLLLADRVDVLESGLGAALGKAARALRVGERTSRRIERDPLPTALGLALAGSFLTALFWNRRSSAR